MDLLSDKQTKNIPPERVKELHTHVYKTEIVRAYERLSSLPDFSIFRQKKAFENFYNATPETVSKYDVQWMQAELWVPIDWVFWPKTRQALDAYINQKYNEGAFEPKRPDAETTPPREQTPEYQARQQDIEIAFAINDVKQKISGWQMDDLFLDLSPRRLAQQVDVWDVIRSNGESYYVLESGNGSVKMVDIDNPKKEITITREIVKASINDPKYKYQILKKQSIENPQEAWELKQKIDNAIGERAGALAGMYKTNPEKFLSTPKEWPEWSKLDPNVLELAIKNPDDLWVRQSDIDNAWWEMPAAQKAMIEQAVRKAFFSKEAVWTAVWVTAVALIVWWCTILVKKDDDE